MKVSDFIVEFLISKGITDVFGYPGGMVTHLMDSLGKKSSRIKTHITYHEQAAAFAACGYAQASDKVGVAFATSGPGATNLITGIGNAYFDSIPTIFITGQVNTFESKGEMSIRQKGFQETNIVPMVSEITKTAFYVKDASSICEILEEAIQIAKMDRQGPVLLDIPMNVFRADIEPKVMSEHVMPNAYRHNGNLADPIKVEQCLQVSMQAAKKPCLILGNGIKSARQVTAIRDTLCKCPLPVVSSMLAVDVITGESDINEVYYGFIGAYGSRTANFIIAKSDLIICLGTRLDVRQVGGKREQFAPNARIVRIDIDEAELSNHIREDEDCFLMNLHDAIPILNKVLEKNMYSYADWLAVCKKIKKELHHIDDKEPNRFIAELSRNVPDGYSIVADVGQHMVWIAQSFQIKLGQGLYLSGGMGSMGYALPAAIGIYYATKKPVICFAGDGGLQMNIQELQFLVREQLPIKIVILNNSALGMIRHFQEMYFDSQYYFTVPSEGYSVPDFVKVAEAYGIRAKKLYGIDDIKTISWNDVNPELFEIVFTGDTYVFPKLEFGKPNQDQEPLLERTKYNYLMEL